jgi:hypothetical protein
MCNLKLTFLFLNSKPTPHAEAARLGASTGEIMDGAGGRIFGSVRLSTEDVPVGVLYKAPSFAGLETEHQYCPVDRVNHTQRAVYDLPRGTRHLPRLLPGLTPVPVLKL